MGDINKKLLYLNLFLLQSYLIRFEVLGYPSNLQEILIGLNLFAFLYSNSFKKIKEIFKRHFFIWAIIGLTGLSLLTSEIINNIDLIRNLKFTFFSIILALVFLETFKSKTERKKGITILGLGALCFGLFALIYNLLGFNLTHDLRLNGPLDSAVYLAFYLSPFFIYFTTQAIDKISKKHITYATILGLLIIGTQSMGAIGACTLTTLLYLFLKKKKSVLNNKIVKISTLAIALTVSIVIFYSKVLPTIQTNYSSLDERGEIWLTTAHQFKDPQKLFFGFGLGQFQEIYQENAYSVLKKHPQDYNNQHPHNIFLAFLTQYGILGLALITYIAYLTSKKLKTPDPVTMIIIYFFIHGLIDSPYFKNDITFLMIIFIEIGLRPFYSKPETKSFKTA
jgi:O-antigen ligase